MSIKEVLDTLKVLPLPIYWAVGGCIAYDAMTDKSMDKDEYDECVNLINTCEKIKHKVKDLDDRVWLLSHRSVFPMSYDEHALCAMRNDNNLTIHRFIYLYSKMSEEFVDVWKKYSRSGLIRIYNNYDDTVNEYTSISMKENEFIRIRSVRDGKEFISKSNLYKDLRAISHLSYKEEAYLLLL